MFILENPGGGCNNPPFGGCVTENASGGRGLEVFTGWGGEKGEIVLKLTDLTQLLGICRGHQFQGSPQDILLIYSIICYLYH